MVLLFFQKTTLGGYPETYFIPMRIPEIYPRGTTVGKIWSEEGCYGPKIITSFAPPPAIFNKLNKTNKTYNTIRLKKENKKEKMAGKIGKQSFVSETWVWCVLLEEILKFVVEKLNYSWVWELSPNCTKPCSVPRTCSSLVLHETMLWRIWVLK